MPSLVGQNGEVPMDKLEKPDVRNVRWGSADGSASVVLLPANCEAVKQHPRADGNIKPGDLLVLIGVKLR
ncbi:hypothetical protein ACSNOI_26735 [Actinomadura kijaniata]|uniref:hypothetical protein n=1 Tax=Actinomadura kijaniata TaxID=46161 RepID=UPI003F1E2894